jgi:riboflavin biosynthesis pyrimidine reductase
LTFWRRRRTPGRGPHNGGQSYPEPPRIELAGPDLARGLTDLGLIDEYRLYLRPIVLGSGTPFFAGPTPPLRLVANELIGEDAIRLTYVPA